MARSGTDTALLFSTRAIRLFAYGSLSVILALYLEELGFDGHTIGLLLTATLAGDACLSLLLSTRADRFGRRRTLVIGAVLMSLAGATFAVTRQTVFLVLAAIVGVISPTGNEIGPFLAVEQAALTQLVPDRRRTATFAWYSLAGSLASALGALVGGLTARGLQNHGFSPLVSYRALFSGYALAGAVLLVCFLALSREVEVVPPPVPLTTARRLGLHRSTGTVARLSGLFALDAFAGGLIIQSFVAYWFHLRFGVHEGVLGGIFFGANLLAGASALLAARLAARIGLVNTMVFTHLPSNILLCLVPVMPTLGLAVALLLLRYSVSQMDVPTRQSYTMAVVDPDERSAASGVTMAARTVGAAISPALSGLLITTSLALPFLVSGGLKIVYDLLLFRAFRGRRPPEEERA